MKPIPTSHLAEALAALDPADRALLELSFRGGMPADEVADVLGSSETSVVDRREAALAELADELGEERGGRELERTLTEADEDAWRSPPAETAVDHEAEVTDTDEAPAPAADEQGGDGAPGRPLGSLKRRLILLGLAALALGIAAGILIATSQGDSDDSGEDGAGTPPAAERTTTREAPARSPRRPKRELGPVVDLEPQIQGVDGRVAARLIRSGGRVRLALRARDLPKPKGNYEVWLLDAPKRPLSLARFKTEDFELDARLPRDFAGYQQLDVTLELEDGNEDHSGASAFVTPIENLAIK